MEVHAGPARQRLYLGRYVVGSKSVFHWQRLGGATEMQPRRPLHGLVSNGRNP